MKTTGLSFLEAVKALSDGKCEKIESPPGTKYGIMDGTVSLIGSVGIGLGAEDFLGEWKLIGAKQKFVGEGIYWDRNGGAVFPVGRIKGMRWKDLIDKPKMKVTLEWAE